MGRLNGQIVRQFTAVIGKVIRILRSGQVASDAAGTEGYYKNKANYYPAPHIVYNESET